MDQTDIRWYLTEDVSSAKGKVYGRAGQRVTIIAEHDNVMIVEGFESKERFSVQFEKLKAQYGSGQKGK